MKKRAGIIGFGNIGKQLYQKLVEQGYEVVFIVTSKHIFIGNLATPKDVARNWRQWCKDVDVVFLAIPTIDDGYLAFKYINFLAGRGIKVVTCEKGAIANYFAHLKPLLSHIGYSATVGGGLGMNKILQQRFSSGMQEVHAILNGTLNYIFNDLAMGNPLGHIIEEVQKLGYAEPGKRDPLKIIQAEACMDATKKAVILFNLCFNSLVAVRAMDISINLTNDAVALALSEAKNRRFVVSFYRTKNYKEEASNIFAFHHIIGDWVIAGRFSRMENPLIARLCNATSWVNNGLLTVEGRDGADGVYVFVGPGAGPTPTTAAMIRDAENL